MLIVLYEDHNWCEPKPILCGEGTECQSERFGYNCFCKDGFTKFELVSLTSPYIENCERTIDMKFIWIIIIVILGILIIQLLIFFLYALRRKKNMKEKELFAAVFDLEKEETPLEFEQKIDIPRPRLNYYRNPIIFEQDFSDNRDIYR